jgi:hypothetical protein
VDAAKWKNGPPDPDEELRDVRGKFPELRPAGAPPSGYEFVFKQGPDFYFWLCEPKVKSAGARDPGFGVYFGTAPSFSSSRVQEPGIVAGLPVAWSEWRTDAEVRREALLWYRHGSEYMTIQLHVFVHAPSQDQLEPLLTALASLRFSEK